MKCASFFAGIGGFDLGLEKAGIETVFQCELDKFCLNILEKHWPKATKFRDIKELKGSDISEVDIWCGGFPCQDVSVARGWLGRDGLKGENTGLFYQFSKLIEEKMPKVILMENVSGLLSSHDGKDFSIIISTLNKLGYGVAWRTLNTRYFGAPQSRPRVFICAWAMSAERAYNVLFENTDLKKVESPRLGFLRKTVCEETGAIVPEVSFCLAATSGRHTGTDWSRSYVSYNSSVRRLTPSECERIQGFPAGWTLPDSNFKVSQEKIDSMRYKSIGNAVSVPVIEWIGERLKNEMFNGKSKIKNDLFSDVSRFLDSTSEFRENNSRLVEVSDVVEHDDAEKIKWAGAGIAENFKCVMGSVPHIPSTPIPSLFVDALDKSSPEKKYFLSSNAAKGILRRVNGQGRKLFDPLEQALYKLQMQEENENRA